MKSKTVIDFFGGTVATGKALGITSQAVSQWGEEVPGSRVKTVEMAMHLARLAKVEACKKKAKQA